MKKRKYLNFFLPIFISILMSNCASFRSEMTGKYEEKSVLNSNKDNVSVLFIFRHIKQAKGLDEIPKLQRERGIIKDFDNLFTNAFRELKNVNKYATFTEFPSDVSKPERRAKLDTLIQNHDYVMRMNIGEEFSFIKQFLGIVVSSVSLTLVPVSYKTSFSIDAELFDNNGKLIKKYERSTSLKKWVQTFMLFVHPFHNEYIKKEQIYLEFMRDIFMQIESENILIMDK